MIRSRGREDERSYSVGEGRQDIFHLSSLSLGMVGNITSIVFKFGMMKASKKMWQIRHRGWAIYQKLLKVFVFWDIFFSYSLWTKQGIFIPSVWSFIPAIVSGSLSRGLRWTSQDVGVIWWESRLYTRSTTSSNHRMNSSIFYFIILLFREFLECIPDVIFFQDCIQEEDITNVLNEVLRNGYKIHFQVGERS